MKFALLLALGLALPLHAGNKHPAAPNPPKPHAGKAFKKTDKDGDGFLSKEEFLARAEKIFSRKDKDGDGKLSPTESARHKNKAAKPGKGHNKDKAAKPGKGHRKKQSPTPGTDSQPTQ